jgi:hypothetical protein
MSRRRENMTGRYDEFALGIAAGLSVALVLFGYIIGNIVGLAIITMGLITLMGSAFGISIRIMKSALEDLKTDLHSEGR